jgi:hypothetical protein
METKDKIVYDYSPADKKVDKIIKMSASYLMIPVDEIAEQIKKAYLYARDAHE